MACFKHYWHCLGRDEKIYSKRSFKGGSLMIWIGFAYGGKKRLAFLGNRMDSKEYQKMLGKNLIPLIEELGNENCLYQQDNASIHVSNSTKKWLLSENISCLDWPALSPDLNPAENVFAIISRRLYENGKQYNTIA